MTMTISANFPDLPLICLQSANELSTHELVKGKNIVIDFWTTRCTRCPAALDKLNAMAADPKYQDVDFVSICCDMLDGAREIIEKEDELRWQNMHHYFMEQDDKEKAKKILGFKMVPFYVVLNENGEIVQMGNKVDFEQVPGLQAFEEKENEVESGYVDVKKEDASTPSEERVFVLDDLDF